MEFKDYYSILGLKPAASEDEIRRAYRKFARKYHPDVSKEADAEVRMRDINEAYDVLRDKEKRSAYDNLAAQVGSGGRGADFAPPPGWDQGFEFRQGPRGAGMGERGAGAASEADFSEFFSSIFGQAGRAAHARGAGGSAGAQPEFRARGEDHHAAIEVSLDDALHGATRDITLRAMEADAQGRAQWRNRTLSVNIPAGIREGQYIRLAGQGMPGYGGESSGDLYLEVRFQPHPLYRVEGRDLYMNLPVTPSEAALGAAVTAPTPGGSVEVTIPPNSRGGRKLRLKGRGIPGDPAGDLYLLLEIVLPPADSEIARQAYQKLAHDLPFNPRSHLGV
ncbi:MAG: DnaJ C-terminal domain-containing protein [Janthinobacterium lividum]